MPDYALSNPTRYVGGAALIATLYEPVTIINKIGGDLTLRYEAVKTNLKINALAPSRWLPAYEGVGAGGGGAEIVRGQLFPLADGNF